MQPTCRLRSRSSAAAWRATGVLRHAIMTPDVIAAAGFGNDARRRGQTRTAATVPGVAGRRRGAVVVGSAPGVGCRYPTGLDRRCLRGSDFRSRPAAYLHHDLSGNLHRGGPVPAGGHVGLRIRGGVRASRSAGAADPPPPGAGRAGRSRARHRAAGVRVRDRRRGPPAVGQGLAAAGRRRVSARRARDQPHRVRQYADGLRRRQDAAGAFPPQLHDRDLDRPAVRHRASRTGAPRGAGDLATALTTIITITRRRPPPSSCRAGYVPPSPPPPTTCSTWAATWSSVHCSRPPCRRWCRRKRSSGSAAAR